MSPRTKEQLHEIREKARTKILESALSLFAENGYHGTSISQIAEKAGISKGLAYNYFESKQKILEAIIMYGFSMIASAEDELSDMSDPRRQLTLLIENWFVLIKENEHIWRLYTSLILQPGVMESTKELLWEFYVNFYNRTEEILRAAGIDNPSAEAKILGAILDGVGMGYLWDKENYPFEEIKDALIKKYT